MRKQNLFLVISMIFVVFLLTTGCGGNPAAPPIEEDFINMISVTPDSGLVDGVDTDFTVVVEYNLFTCDAGTIDVTIHPYLTSTIGLVIEKVNIDKGSGMYEFNFTIKPVNWGVDLSLAVHLKDPAVEYPSLDWDYRMLTFEEGVTPPD